MTSAKRSVWNPIKDDQPLLSYDDYVLYGCDIRSLRQNNGWLTDNVMMFATKYLTDKITTPKSIKVSIVSPTLCELIKVSDAEIIHRLLDGAEVEQAQATLFLLSDNVDPQLPMGGTHWRLLMFQYGRFHLFDPADTNAMTGRKPDDDVVKFVKRLKSFFALEGVDIIERRITGAPMYASGECGVYVIEYINVILKTLAENCDFKKGRLEFDFASAMPPSYMKDVRTYWLNIIEAIINK